MQVSRDTCRRSPKILCQRMGKNNTRSVGSLSTKRRPQVRFHIKTPFHRGSTDQCQCSTRKYFTAGGRQIIKKRCNRTCTSRQDTNRFLFNIFPCSKENGGFKTSYKLKTTEQVSQETTLQDGLSKQGHESSSTRRLGDFNRLERCLFSHTNSSSTQKIPKILHSRQGISVYMPLLRSNDRAKVIYEGRSSRSSLFKGAQSQTSSVFGRLVSRQPNQEVSNGRQREIAQPSSESRFSCQSREINVMSKSNHNIHRGSFSSEQRNGFPNSGKNSENRASNFSYKERTNSSEFPPFVRINGILYRAGPSCPSVYETSTTPSTTLLETCNKRSPTQNSSKQTLGESFEVVAKQGQSIVGKTIPSEAKFKSTDNRCLKTRLWRSFGKPDLSGHLVSTTEDITYKLPGVGGSISINPTFPSSVERPECTGKVGQHNSSSVYKQTRGHTVTSTVLPGMGLMENGNKESDNVDSSSFIRYPKRPGGRFESRKDKAHRVDTKQCGNFGNLSFMGQTNGRPVCFGGKSQSKNILLVDSQSPSLGNRCLVSVMGKHGSLRFPSNMSNTKGITAHEEVSMPVDSDCTTVAQKKLVYKSSSDADSMSSKVTHNTQSVIPTKNNNSTSKSSSVQSCCMAAINRSFINKGFSTNTRTLLAASWRPGTQRDYSVKFHKFCGWCREREIDPYKATLTNCADFLTSLFQSGLKYRTIAGYRSMLSTMLPLVDKFPIGQHPDIVRLLKGIFNSRPPEKRLVPEWDLKQVLNFLSGKPFEPMLKCSLKYLTWKTVFLTAVTTFRRCGDIQALRIDDGFMSIVPEGIIFIREGLSKQDRPGHVGRKIFVPCFHKNSKLDPKRALQIYIDRTSQLRVSEGNVQENKLFLSLNKPHKAVCRQTVASWIVNVIRQTYNDTDLKVKAHSTRAIGSSWALCKGASLSSVLEAADWSNDSTFKKFYYRQIDSQEWEL